MKIPSDWVYVLKSGHDTFVHTPSASSVQIQVLTYYPQVNTVSFDTLKASCMERGCVLTEYERFANNGYYLIYQSQGMEGLTDYIEYVYYDRSHVVKVLFTFLDSNYERMKDHIWNSIDSVSWEYEDPIDDDLMLIYSVNGDFEFAVPISWNLSNASDAFYAYDEATGAYITVNLLSDDSSIDNISELDYAQFLSEGREDFSLITFIQDGSSIYGEATFRYGDTYHCLLQCYVANRTYHYIITFECGIEYTDKMVPLCQKTLSYLRVFY